MNDLHYKIDIVQGDITKVRADAIVNAANTSLLGGGGVDGAIHRAGGKEILNDCRKVIARQGGCRVGQAVITTAGKLPSKYVIHTVGPVWCEGYNEEEQRLTECYLNSLQLAVENNCQTIAFPNISTGVYNFPKAKAAAIAMKTVADFIKTSLDIRRVTFVCFDSENHRYMQQAFREYIA